MLHLLSSSDEEDDLDEDHVKKVTITNMIATLA